MEILNTFKFNDNKVRIYGSSLQPYFVGKDVCDILEYKKPWNALSQHVDEDDKTTTLKKGGGFLTLINESGLYSLILRSNQKIAKQFKHKVTSEILPEIRRTGEYRFKKPLPMLTYSINNECDLQMKTVNFCRQNHTEKQLLFCSTHGEDQHTMEDRLKHYRLGYTSGIPDFIIFNHTKNHKGMVIEFKTPKCNGELSDKQRIVIRKFKSLGYKCIVSNNYDDILIRLNDYIRDIRIDCDLCKCKFKSIETKNKHLKYFHRKSI